jgi:hypothetical protein
MPATPGGRLTVLYGQTRQRTPYPVRRPGPPALAATVDRSGDAHTELHNMRPLMTMIDTPTERAESALGSGSGVVDVLLRRAGP